ncbi:DUF418 domain-containing protein [Microlunatus parietis]|uniref:Putative membrane protein YeiB n=1 Tax=Microlunatus parietis TaxID=682979 RepID=A0A7Y9IC72_9ACTN|nr:DUF418 domain-containing protein [Microlunatus parietis]NYE74184.1 putative membrane protein YeiB [Microlunatus parietis]
MTGSLTAEERGPRVDAPGGRAPAPDLARGLMLLVIALAHAPLFTVVARAPGGADAVTEVLHLLFVNNHARSMFAFLFGYALVQLADRRPPAESDAEVRGLIRRRGGWLIMIGFLHVALLAPVDILAGYGLVAVLFAGLLRARDATLLRVAAGTAVPAVGLAGVLLWYPLSQGVSSYALNGFDPGARDPWALLIERVLGWPAGLVIGVVLVLPAVILGIWAARRRLLEQPERHRRLLLGIGVGSTLVALAGAVPAILIQTGSWPEPTVAGVALATFLQPLTGFVGGIGVIGFIAVAASGQRRPGLLATALQALGRRSLTFYLVQSVIFVAVCYPYGLGLGDRLGITGASILAVIIWLASLLAADLMRRLGHRGPAEILLRRLVSLGGRRASETGQ